MGSNVGRNFLGNTAEHRVAVVVAGNDLRGGGQVHLHVGGNGVLDHVQGNVAHRVQVVQHADGACAVRVEMERYLGNVAGLVSDALNVGDHLQRRGDLAQVARHGLLAQKQR